MSHTHTHTQCVGLAESLTRSAKWMLLDLADTDAEADALLFGSQL